MVGGGWWMVDVDGVWWMCSAMETASTEHGAWSMELAAAPSLVDEYLPYSTLLYSTLLYSTVS